MSSVYATSKCMLDYYRKGNMARDEPQLVRAYGRKNFDPVIKEWKWPDFGNVTITLARTEGLKNFDPDAEITSWDRMKVSVPSKNPKLQKTQCMLECGEWITTDTLYFRLLSMLVNRARTVSDAFKDMYRDCIVIRGRNRYMCYSTSVKSS
jgi:hypothetical protein